MKNRKLHIWSGLMIFFDKYWGCHQIAERSFFIGGYQFPVCARCTGMILGYISAIVLWFLVKPVWMVVFLVFPMLADGFTQYWGWRESNNLLRMVTGGLFGYALLSGVFLLVSYIFFK